VVAGQNLYLTNFGYAPLLEKGNQQAFEECREFLAPEVLQQQGLLLAADIYAFAKTVGSCHPQMTGTSWYSQATKPNPDQRLKGIRTSFTALERAFNILFGLNNPKKPEPKPQPEPINSNGTIIPKYLLDVTVEPPDGGLVITDNSTYLANKVATVTATASSGWQFEGWSGDLSGTENPAKVRMDGDKAIVANFIGVSSSRELIVSPSGAGHYRTISEAIKKAPVNATIQVMPGVYREGLVLDKSIGIWGMGTVEEIVIESTDAPCLLMQTESAFVRGLTLRGRAGTSGNKYYAVDIPQGELILENCDITSDSLACVAIHGSQANPTISNCRIHYGQASGVYLADEGQGKIDNCSIFGNTKAGIVIGDYGNPTISNCQIHDGKASGIYVYKNGQGKVENSDIFSNAFAGIEIKQCGNPTIRNCQIHDGKQVGILVNDKGQGVIENCTIYGNALAGIRIEEGANPIIRDCNVDRRIDERKPEPQPHKDERSQQQKEAEERQRLEAERLRQQKQEKERQRREAERLQKQREKQVKVVTSFIGLFLATTTLGWFLVPVESWTLIANFPMPFRNYLMWGVVIIIACFPIVIVNNWDDEKDPGMIIGGVLLIPFVFTIVFGLKDQDFRDYIVKFFESKEFFSKNTERICRDNTLFPLNRSLRSECFESEIPNYQISELIRISIFLVTIVVIAGLLNLLIFKILYAILQVWNDEIKTGAIFTAFLGLVIGWQVHHSFL